MIGSPHPAAGHSAEANKNNRHGESEERQIPLKKLLIFAAALETLTGLTLLVSPSFVIRLLLGAEIAGVGFAIGRIAGISLIAMAVACWPDRTMLRAFFGMLTYNLPVTLYLVYMGLNGGAGILLWPAVVVHAGLSLLLLRAWWTEIRT